LALLNSSIEIFSYRSVQAIIDYKFEIAKPQIQTKLLLPFLGYLLTFTFFFEITFNDHNQNTASPKLQVTTIVTQFFIISFSSYFLWHHFTLFRSRIGYWNIACLWSIMDLIPVLANLISIAIFFLASNQKSTLQYQRPIYGFATLAIWFKVFYFLRMYEEIGHLVRNIFQIIWVMRYFFIMFMFWLIMFTSAFYALTPNSTLAQ
jgi:hypothetical protein